MNETITVEVNGEKIKVPVPNGFTLRKQNPDCASKGCVCAILNHSLVCCKMQLKQEKNGDFSLFQINPCSKGDGKIKI